MNTPFNLAAGGMCFLQIAAGVIFPLALAAQSPCPDKAVLQQSLRQTRIDVRDVQNQLTANQARLRHAEKRRDQCAANLVKQTTDCANRQNRIAAVCQRRSSLLDAQRALQEGRIADLQFRHDNCTTLRDCNAIQHQIDKAIRRLDLIRANITRGAAACSASAQRASERCSTQLSDTQARMQEFQRLADELSPGVAPLQALLVEAQQRLADAQARLQACYPTGA
jgi:chromosome segregation ATPase